MCNDRDMVRQCRKTVLAPQLQFIGGRRPPFVPQRANPHGPAFSEYHRGSAVAVCQVVDAPVVAGRVMPVVVLTGAHGSDTAENCGGAAVAVRRFWSQVVDISVVVQRQIPMVLFTCSWTRSLTCPLLSTTGAYGQTLQKTAVFSAVAVCPTRSSTSLSWCRGQIPMVLFRTIEILQLQDTDKVIDVPVVPVLFPSAGVGRRQPSSHAFPWTRWLTCPVCTTISAHDAVNKVVDVAVFMQRQVPGSAGRCLRAVHRQDVQVLRRGDFARILRHFSHFVRMDVSAHFSALNDEEFFVVEGSGWRGRRESDSQVFCHSN